MIFRTLKNNTETVINELLGEWNKAAVLVFCNKILNHHNQFVSIVRAPNNDDKAIAKARTTFLDNVHKIISETDIGKLFVSINSLVENLKQKKTDSPLLTNGIDQILINMDAIWAILNDLSRNPKNYNLIVKLIKQFEETMKTFQYFQNCHSFLKSIDKIIGGVTERKDFENAIELEFSMKIRTLGILITRLTSLNSIYSETCLIFEVKESEFPLRISKIETGSLWGKLFGDSKVIDFISWFLKNSIKYLHRSFTTEGKLSQIPTDLEILEREFDFHSKLKGSLTDKRYKELMGESEDTLIKSMVLLSKHTQKLIEKETKLKIDSEKIELSASNSEKYLLEAQKQLSEHPQKGDDK